jgi:hypothetical protein
MNFQSGISRSAFEQAKAGVQSKRPELTNFPESEQV